MACGVRLMVQQLKGSGKRDPQIPGRQEKNFGSHPGNRRSHEHLSDFHGISNRKTDPNRGPQPGLARFGPAPFAAGKPSCCERSLAIDWVGSKLEISLDTSKIIEAPWEFDGWK